MSNYLGEAFERELGKMMGCAVVLLILAIVCAFFLGRCSGGIEFQSPIKTKQEDKR